jgi:hypothetical protein
MMMLAMCVRSFASAVDCASALERDALALDCTHVKVQTKNVAETANQAKNKTKRKEKSLLFFIYFILLETGIKENKL